MVNNEGLCCLQAIQAWRNGSGYSRVQLVKQYFLCVSGGFPSCGAQGQRRPASVALHSRMQCYSFLDSFLHYAGE